MIWEESREHQPEHSLLCPVRHDQQQGHEHPPPTFGAPTLIWHLAISPHWSEKRPEFAKPLKEIHDELARTYEETRTDFFKEINELLKALQRTAGYPQARLLTFEPEHIPAAWQGRRAGIGDPFYVTSPGSIRFTLWWSDANGKPSHEASPDALRVKVHVGAHRDYVTLSFYLDASKPWNAPVVPVGRQRILSQVGRIRSICEARMVADAQGARAIDREILPEHDLTEPDAGVLLAASRDLYTDVWNDFCKAMGIEKLASNKTGRVFANFCGLVMTADGLPEAVEPRAFPGSSGAEPFPRFKGNGGIDHTGTRSSDEPNEANAVAKAFWPFVRRSIRAADRKEFIACGVMSWRALYVTALNCPPTFDWLEEARSSETDIPAGQLPDESADDKSKEPIHHLLITKGEPHRRQIGRIVERINSMGTMRLIALRDYGIIRDASTQIQLRGQELDTMMRKWSVNRAKIRADFESRSAGTSGDMLRNLQDVEDEEIQRLADGVEKDLIELSAALDEVGLEAVHGLHFRINRSRYYVCEFESLLESLKIGNIDTWVSYDQFVTRGLKPAFDFIDGVGVRLLGLRTRLQSVLEGIETGALVRQSSATRQNTMHLRRIADTFTRLQKWLRIAAILIAVASLIAGLFGLQGVLGKMIGWLQP